MGPSLDRSESDGRRIDDFEREHRLTNVPNLRLGEEVLAGRRLEDLVIDDEDDHLQQERQPADGRGRAGAVRAPFPRGRRGRGRRTAADVGPISRERENNSAGAVVRAEFARKPGAPGEPGPVWFLAASPFAAARGASPSLAASAVILEAFLRLSSRGGCRERRISLASTHLGDTS